MNLDDTPIESKFYPCKVLCTQIEPNATTQLIPNWTTMIIQS